jgi:hypothetical protein
MQKKNKTIMGSLQDVRSNVKNKAPLKKKSQLLKIKTVKSFNKFMAILSE